jgi:hypothetical protein
MRQHIKAFIAALSAVVLIGVALFATQSDSDNKTAKPQAANDTPAPPPAAPQVVDPQNGTAFVESDLTLSWDWSPGLEANQAFAVHVWFGEESPREVWTVETSLNAQEMIDSYSQEIGDFHWQVAVIQEAAGGGFERMVSEWSPVQTLNRVRHISPTPYAEAQQSSLTRYILAQDLPSATAVIDYTRELIYANTLSGHEWEDEPKNVVAIQMMYDTIQGQGEKPYLWCDGRATAFMTLLREMGIDSRLIFLYGDNADQIQEHTVLEAFNPDTQQWEVQDALHDIYYVDTDTQARASIERLVFGSLETIIACDGAAGSCSPDQLAPFRRFFEAFRYGYSDTFWVNPDRFDVSKRFPQNDNANLAEYLTGNPRDFKFYFDSWTDEKP